MYNYATRHAHNTQTLNTRKKGEKIMIVLVTTFRHISVQSKLAQQLPNELKIEEERDRFH